MIINKVTWDKVKLYPPDTNDILSRGYGSKRTNIKSIVIHTTNGNIGTTFENEASYIYKSRKISSHFLVGKGGEIAQILDPTWIAYHAGTVWPTYKYYGNPYSIGIECHHAIGEQWTFQQKKILFDLCRSLCSKYSIRLLETHRKIAKPFGRKVDPSDFEDSDFYSFTKRLFYDNVSEDYITLFNCNVRETPSTQAKILEVISKNTRVDVSDFEEGEIYKGDATWVKLVSGGYIWKNLLRII